MFENLALLEYASPSAFVGFASSPRRGAPGSDSRPARPVVGRATSIEEGEPSTATAPPGDLPSTDELVRSTGLSTAQLGRLLDGSAEAPVFIVELLGFADDSGDAYRPYREALEPAIEAAGGALVWRGAYDALMLGGAVPGFHEMAVTRYPNRSAYLGVLSDEGVISATAA